MNFILNPNLMKSNDILNNINKVSANSIFSFNILKISTTDFNFWDLKPC